MSQWLLYSWTWELISPLHIGKSPAGFLDRTRLYVPARTLWGALSAEIARQISTNFPPYEEIGKKLDQWVRLSYLFPAQKDTNEWRVWLPKFCEGKGLIWYRLDAPDQPVEERHFRTWLLYTRPSTAIEPETETAEEGTLREHEIIMPISTWGRDVPEKVALMGYLFVWESVDSFLFDRLRKTKRLFIGGDSRYGQGWIEREDDLRLSDSFLGYKTALDDLQGPVITTSHILAHTLAENTENNQIPELKGELETLTGRDQISHWEGLFSGHICWVPGSICQKEKPFIISSYGIWKPYHT